MHALWTLAGLILTTTAAATLGQRVADVNPALESSFTQDAIANGTAFYEINQIVLSRMQTNIDARRNSTCTFDNARLRTDFRNMSLSARKSFTKAIICLQKRPPVGMTLKDHALYPGVQSRYDQYVATHINYTYNIHMTASFFAWHRMFVWQFEQDLQRLCHYNGTLPYWNWQIDAHAPQDSELFNGDQYSMGSNGAYIANRSDTFLGLQNVNFPPGTGGGCVTKGPFSNYTVHLGPLDSPYNDNVKSSFDYNPRCLVRDLNPWFSSRYNTYGNVTDLLLNYNTIGTFQAETQGYNDDMNRFGVHGGGHWLGGGPSALEDFHSSPSDPIFFLHHAMVDRIWVMWQYMDISRRQNTIRGTSTLNNNPPSAEMTLSDMLPFGLIGQDQVFGDLMDTFSGPFCYRYD